MQIKTSANRRQPGVSDEQLKRLHAPVGLSIYSKTPAEIAIAIIAELIAVRALSKRPLYG